MKKIVLRFLGICLVTLIAFGSEKAEARVTCTYVADGMPDIIVEYEPNKDADSFVLDPGVSVNNVAGEDYILYYRMLDATYEEDSEWYIATRDSHNAVPLSLMPLKNETKKARNYITYNSWVNQRTCFPTIQFYYKDGYSAVIFTREELANSAEYDDYLDREKEGALYTLVGYNDSEAVMGETTSNTYKKVQCGDVVLPKMAATLVRTVYIILQIAVPVIIVLLGSLDFLKATIAQKEDEIKKYQHIFLRRLFLGAVVFIIFALVQLVIGIVAPHNANPGMWDCADCLINGDCK